MKKIVSTSKIVKIVDDLSKVLNSDSFNVYYLFRHHNHASIVVVPVDPNDDIALCDLKHFCLSSNTLDNKYFISLEHIISTRSYINKDGVISLFTRDQYELTMPNNPKFKSIVKTLYRRQFDHNLQTILKQKGGVNQ